MCPVIKILSLASIEIPYAISLSLSPQVEFQILTPVALYFKRKTSSCPSPKLSV
ncbi:MAG: hypothetical protein ACTSPQ_19685 [Candidatus Helarchaeota archaeon]